MITHLKVFYFSLSVFLTSTIIFHRKDHVLGSTVGSREAAHRKYPSMRENRRPLIRSCRRCDARREIETTEVKRKPPSGIHIYLSSSAFLPTQHWIIFGSALKRGCGMSLSRWLLADTVYCYGS